MDLSVVTGTYNRIDSLKRMINSVRNSYVPGFQCHNIVVDGGSTDGTIEWCKDQLDIQLIQHGSLLGAIKAFNDGAYASNADYVIMGNDDIEYMGQSILNAWIFMQNNPICGIGCFHQNRNNKDWHIELMPCVVDGIQRMLPYGQVCIIPRWLGDKVKWWGDWGGMTYGGDNEMSANVYETGFKVLPIRNCKVYDWEVQDQLRDRNNVDGSNDPRAIKGHHPDSYTWGRKWANRQTGTMGPIVRNTPKWGNTLEKKERIIYLPIFEQGWEIQKKEKKGLRLALEKVGVVIEIDYLSENARNGKGAMLEKIKSAFKDIQPTIVLTQIHTPDVITISDLRYLKALTYDCLWINWNGDYWPDNLVSPTGLELSSMFDVQLTVNITANKELQSKGINVDYWQIGFEPTGISCEYNKSHDVVFLANGYSKKRLKLVREIKNFDFDFGLYGTSWPKEWANGSNLYNFTSACKIYRGAKISIGDSQWPDAEGYISNRVMQAMAAGGSLFCIERFKGMEKLGLIDGETVATWQTTAELKKIIQYYLDNEDIRQKISQAGEKLALEKFSFDYRVKELLDIVSGMRKEEVDWR